MLAEVAAVQRFAGGGFNQLRGGKAAAVLPDILPQPLEQGAEIPFCDGGIKVRQRGACSVEQLRGVHSAKGIGWEIAKAAVGPVDILHAAVAVVAHGRDAQPVLHLLIPQGRNVLYLNLTVDQRSLNLIAQDHMRGVAHFVSIHADEARLHLLVPGDEILFAKGGLRAKTVDDRWQETL